MEIGLRAVAVHFITVNFVKADRSIDFHQTLLIVVCCISVGLMLLVFFFLISMVVSKQCYGAFQHALIPRGSDMAVLTKQSSQKDTDVL